MDDIKFPKFRTMISSEDFAPELQRLKDLKLYREEDEVKIILDKLLPDGSAILIDINEKIVAVIQDHKVVEIK